MQNHRVWENDTTECYYSVQIGSAIISIDESMIFEWHPSGKASLNSDISI